MEASRLEEVQGLYGPVCLSELVVQKLWLRQDLDPRGLKTADGLPVEVHFPGEWNRLGGPDFRHAELTMGGQRRVGDIELHFHARDWFAHGHHTDPAYNQVILLVFPPRVDEPAVHREDGGDVPHLWLTPHCREDLEAYALADAIGALGQADLLDVAAPWLERPLGERRQQIITTARTRWEQKTHWAAQRLAEASWEEAVHQWTLEVLGDGRDGFSCLRLGRASS